MLKIKKDGKRKWPVNIIISFLPALSTDNRAVTVRNIMSSVASNFIVH